MAEPSEHVSDGDGPSRISNELKDYTLPEFWFGVAILIKNYHALNNNLFACRIRQVRKITRNIDQAYRDEERFVDTRQNEPFEISDSTEQALLETLDNAKEDNFAEGVEGFVYEAHIMSKKRRPPITIYGVIGKYYIRIEIRIYIYRLYLFLLDFTRNKYTAYVNYATWEDFYIIYEDDFVIINFLTNRNPCPKRATWLRDTLIVKVLKWMDGYDGNVRINDSITSLGLIDPETFNRNYHELKMKCLMRAFDVCI